MKTLTRIRRWPIGDELPIAAAALTVDEGDGWWAGSQRCFVGLALAGAASALALSTAHAHTLATQTDEITVPPASIALADDAAVPWVAMEAANKLTIWSVADDVVPAAPAFTALDEHVAPLARYSDVKIFVVWATDEDAVFAPPLPADDYWHRLTWVPAPLVARVWQQQDEITTAPPALQVDEAYWQQPHHVSVQPLATVWQQPDELPMPAAVLPLDEWGSWPFTLNLQTAYAAPIWHDDVAFGDAFFTEDSRLRIGAKIEAVPDWRIGRKQS